MASYNFNVSPYTGYKTQFQDTGLNTTYGAPQAETAGLGYASGALQQMANQTYNYPNSYASQLQGPAQQQQAGYVANQGFQQTAAPTYSGLLGGDYAALQSAMEAPVYQAYNRALTDINNAAAGQGLYGSTGQGLQSDQISQAGQNVLLPGLSQATQARLNLQAQDLGQMNQFNASMFPQLVQQQQAAYTSRLSDALRQQDYGQSALDKAYQNQQAQADFANQQLREAYGLDTAQTAWQQGLLQDFLTNSLALAGKASPSASASQAYQAQLQNMAAQQAMAKNAANAQTTSGLYSGIGGLLGGLLS